MEQFYPNSRCFILSTSTASRHERMPPHPTRSTRSPNAPMSSHNNHVGLQKTGIRKNFSRRHTSGRLLPENKSGEAAIEQPASTLRERRASTHGNNSSNEEVAQTDSLPEGCALGIPVVRGDRIWPVSPETLNFAIMRSIGADNYKFIRDIIMSGWAPTNPTGYSFSLKIHSGLGTEEWTISQATPLHYAVCSGSLRAAAAILIAFPDFASMSCKVETSSTRMPQRPMWTTLDLTSFFANLYMPLDSDRHLAYRLASSVILQLQQGADVSALFANFDSARPAEAGEQIPIGGIGGGLG